MILVKIKWIDRYVLVKELTTNNFNQMHGYVPDSFVYERYGNKELINILKL